MPFYTIDQIKVIIHEAPMKRVLMAVMYLAEASEKEASKICQALTQTLARYKNEDCWKDIICYSPIAVDVCEALEQGLV
jgi:hypothetical protein